MQNDIEIINKPRILLIDTDPEVIQNYTGYFQHLHQIKILVAITNVFHLQIQHMLYTVGKKCANSNKILKKYINSNNRFNHKLCKPRKKFPANKKPCNTPLPISHSYLPQKHIEE